jgi:predicted PurR-regulated permease PerM
VAARARTVPLALGPAAVGVLIAGIAAGWLVFGAAEAARRPLGWAVACAVVAAILLPVVERLAERMPRILAVVVVFQLVIVAVGSLTFGTLRDLDDEVSRLKETAPEAAAELAASGGFLGDLAADIDLEARVDTLIDELEQPSSGVAAGAATSAGTWFICIVLTAFLLSWGSRLASAGLHQIGDEQRRERIGVALRTAIGNGRRYLLGTITLAIVTGIVTWGACDLEGVPAPLALGVFAAALSVVPAVGVLVGVLPAVLLEVGLGTNAGALRLGVLFVLLQAAHAVVLRRVVAARSLVVGPAVVVIALVVGFDAYGVGGAYYGAALAVFGVAALDAAGKVQVADKGSHAGGEVPVAEEGSGAAGVTPSS